MKNRNINITIKACIIIFILLIITMILLNSKIGKKQIDLIFFDMNNLVKYKKKEENKKKNNSIVEINVTKKANEKEIDFLKILNNDIKINKKIYPGINGTFDILLKSNRKIKYEIEIIDKNRKPKNLEMYFEKKGVISKAEPKKIEVNWEWKYSIDKENDIEDTKDGIELKKYCFNIRVKEID